MLAVINACSAASTGFNADDYYKCVRESATKLNDIGKVQDNEKLSRDLADIAGRLTRQYNSRLGVETRDGTPFNSGGSALVIPRRYRPRVLSMFLYWESAKLTNDINLKEERYRRVIAAMPPDYETWPGKPLYAHPAIFALVVDARLNVNQSGQDALEKWMALQKQFGDDKKHLEICLKQIDDDLLSVGQTFPANYIYPAYLEIKKELSDSYAAVGIKNLECPTAKAGESIVITGKVEGPGQICIWAKDSVTGLPIASPRPFEPGQFKLPIDGDRVKLGDAGTAIVCWKPTDEGFAKFLGLKDSYEPEGAKCAYKIPELPGVEFQANPGQEPGSTIGSDGKNKYPIAIKYSCAQSVESFKWRLLDGNGVECAGTQEAQPKRSGAGDLVIPSGTLARGEYRLLTQREVKLNSETSFTETDNLRVSVFNDGIALVIGIDAYDESNSLKNACHDADKALDQLRKSGYDEKNIIYVKGSISGENDYQSPEVMSSANLNIGKNEYRKVTPTILLRAQNKFAALISKEHPSRVVFFYSGHGMTQREKGSDNTVDVLISARDTSSSLDEQDLNLNQFTDLCKTNAGMTFVALLDACRHPDNNLPTAGLSPKIKAGKYQDSTSLLVPVYSCNIGEYSNDSDELNIDSVKVENGFFTYALFKGMQNTNDITIAKVMPNAVDVMSTLVSQAQNENQKMTAKGVPGRYSTEQTITIGDTPLRTHDDVIKLPSEIQSISLF